MDYNAAAEFQGWKSLNSPKHDVNVLRKLLRRLGIKLIEFENLENAEITQLCMRLEKRLNRDQKLFLHYSGHVVMTKKMDPVVKF
eukprot:UN27911